jgi:Polyketide cyclase / dehydrase and lipid transport
LISLVESRRLPASAEQVWRLFEEMDRHYLDVHPEHLRWRTLRGRPLAVGTVWFADEWVGSMRISSRFFVTDADQGRFFTYRIGFPASLGRAGGSFRFEPTTSGECEVIEEVHFGFKAPLLGRLVDVVLALVLPVREMRRHMREEQQNLAALLEAGIASPGAGSTPHSDATKGVADGG